MENTKDFINPWAYDYSGDDGTGMIYPPAFPGEGVDEQEMNNAIQTAVDKLVNGAPEALDTLGEIAEALENDEDIEAALLAQIAKKLDTETYEADKATFATKDEIPEVPTKVSELENDSDFITAEALDGYAKKEDVYTKDEADAKFLTEHQDISNLATKAELEIVEDKIPTQTSELQNDSDFITTAAVDEKIGQATDGMATEAWVQEQNYLTEHQSLEDYVKKEELATVATSGSYNDLTDKPIIPEIPTDVSAFNNDAGYLTEHQSLEAYPTKEELAAVAFSGDYVDLINKPEIPEIPENVSAFNNDAGYLTEHQSLAEYINGVNYNEESKKIEFKHDENLIAEVDTTDFIKDGMVESVTIENGNLVITFNTESGKQPITIPLTDIFNPANYYTKEEVDEKLGLKANAADLAQVATSGSYNDLSDTPENVSVFNNDAGYLTEHQSLEDYATKTEVETGDSNVLTNILGRIWNNTNEEVSGYFQTKYTNPDGSVAQIWNESDGGGSLYENKTAGLKTFVGVNADGENGVCAQIYSKHTNTNIGSRLNVNPNGMFYGVGSSASLEPENELAVKGDVSAAVEGLAKESDIPTKVSQLENDANYLTEHQDISELATKTEVTNGDNNVKRNILSKIWSNVNDEDKGYFQTKYTNTDGSYAQIWNESDGGGSQYYNATDNIVSYVGVNDGGNDGICVQIYSKNKNTNVGSRLNVNPNGMYYGVGNAASVDAGTELAVKNDIATDRAEVDAIIAEKDAIIASLNSELYNLKKSVGDMGGAVTYELPGVEGKSFNTLMGNNGTVKMVDDVTTDRFGPGIMAKNTVTLNLNTHNLTFTGLSESSAYPGIMSRGTQEITISGKGTVDAGQGICIEANGKDSVINLSGSTSVYQTDRSGGELIYCYAGTINISGGTFRNNGENKTYMLNCYDANYQNGTAKIIVTGGKFYDFDPGNNTAEGPNTSFLAEGYHTEASTVIEEEVEHTVYTVKKDS